MHAKRRAFRESRISTVSMARSRSRLVVSMIAQRACLLVQIAEARAALRIGVGVAACCPAEEGEGKGKGEGRDAGGPRALHPSFVFKSPDLTEAAPRFLRAHTHTRRMSDFHAVPPPSSGAGSSPGAPTDFAAALAKARAVRLQSGGEWRASEAGVGICSHSRPLPPADCPEQQQAC